MVIIDKLLEIPKESLEGKLLELVKMPAYYFDEKLSLNQKLKAHSIIKKDENKIFIFVYPNGNLNQDSTKKYFELSLI